MSIYLTLFHLDGNDGQNDLHSIWRGIKYLWGAEGPVETGQIPVLSTAQADEQIGLKLTQALLRDQKKKLSDRLGL